MSKHESYDFEALSLGSTGSIVLMVQKTFNSIGYELESNGVFDKHMDEVVRDFQSQREILFLDGVVGVETMLELDRLFGLAK
jgi:N-acetyl-anhydromuramyl-L-alanine amidase AmpD